MPGKPLSGAHLFGVRGHMLTAEGEQFEVTSTADSVEELRTRVTSISSVLTAHRTKQNEKIRAMADAEKRRIAGSALNVRDEVTAAQLDGARAARARRAGAGDGTASSPADP